MELELGAGVGGLWGSEIPQYLMCVTKSIQWNLSIVDTTGPRNVSPLERCPYFRG